MNEFAFPGDELRARREAMGLSVDDVYRKLRIPSNMVESLESGEIERLPAMCYATGFLKTYCHLLELDPEHYADSLKECVRPTGRRLTMAKRSSAGGERPAWMQNAITWGSICAVLVLGWVTYAVVLQPKAERGEGRVEADTRLVVEAPQGQVDR